MSTIEYEEEGKIEGGIAAFVDVTEVVEVTVEIGVSAVPSPGSAEEYARKVESVSDAQQAGESVTAELVRL